MESVPALELATAMLKQASQPGGLEATTGATANIRQTTETLASQGVRPSEPSAEQNAERFLDSRARERQAPPGLGQFVDLTV